MGEHPPIRVPSRRDAPRPILRHIETHQTDNATCPVQQTMGLHRRPCTNGAPFQLQRKDGLPIARTTATTHPPHPPHPHTNLADLHAWARRAGVSLVTVLTALGMSVAAWLQTQSRIPLAAATDNEKQWHHPYCPGQKKWRRRSLLGRARRHGQPNGEKGAQKYPCGRSLVRRAGRSAPDLHELFRNRLGATQRTSFPPAVTPSHHGKVLGTQTLPGPKARVVK